MNVYEYIERYGSDEGFDPAPATISTSAQPGSPEKIQAMTDRVERGEELHHPHDRHCFDYGQTVEAMRELIGGVK